MAKPIWKQVHKSSGATVIEAHVKRARGHGCALTVIPADWTRPTGAASWAATCTTTGVKSSFDHKRGSSASVKAAKAAATHAAKKMR